MVFIKALRSKIFMNFENQASSMISKSNKEGAEFKSQGLDNLGTVFRTPQRGKCPARLLYIVCRGALGVRCARSPI